MLKLAISLCLLALTGFYFFFYPAIAQTEQVRYRITVTINTPDGAISSSGVWGYSKAPNLSMRNLYPEWVYWGRVDGEAIPIDLPNGTTLFIVLGSRVWPKDLGTGLEPAYFTSGLMNILPKYPLWNDGSSMPAHFADNRSGSIKEIEWIKERKGIIINLRCSQVFSPEKANCPAIALADKSGRNVQLLDPDNLSATLGHGYSLRSMTLQVVDAPVSRGIERRLPWAHLTSERYFRTPEDELKFKGFIRHDPARLWN